MLDQEAINKRRNPLPKSLEAGKKKESKFVSHKRPDQVYALAVLDQGQPIIFYVGISKNPAKRFKAHQAAIDNPIIVIKDAYSWLRAHTLRSSLSCIVLDEDGLRTEQDWIDQLASEGHPIQNMIGGVDRMRKNRKVDVAVKEKAPQRVPCKSFKDLFKSR